MASTEAEKQGRNSALDKTERAYGGDTYTNQGGGKLGSGNENSGHPANNVLAPQQRHDANPDPAQTQAVAAERAAGADVPHGPGKGGERGTKGSGMPVESGAGQLADDRPGRNAPKGS